MEILKKNSGIVVVMIAVACIVYLYYQASSQSTSLKTQESNLPENTDVLTDCEPAFQDGGGPYYKSNVPFRDDLAPDNHNGETLIVKGKILQNDCKTPVADAVLDIWQANESGNYEDEWYRGKVRTSADGSYSFETVIPKGYGEGTGYRPPHIHFKVYVDNNEVITSQMFFPEIKGRQGFNDAYIMDTETKLMDGKNVHFGNHNIILP